MKPYSEYKESGIEWLGKVPKHWEVVRLKYLTNKVGSGVTPRGGSTVYTEDGICLLRSQNVYSDGLRLDNCVKIPREIHEKMKNSQVQIGDVLLNITGASIGRVYYWEKKGVEANVNQHVCIIRANQKINHQYLQSFIASEAGQMQVFSGQDGTSREGLNIEELKNFKITLSPKNEQQKITQFLDYQTQRIDALIAKKQALIEKLKKQRQAIINEAVTKGLNPDAPMKDSGIEWLGEIPAHWEVIKLKYLVDKVGSGVTPRGGSEVYTEDGVLLLRSQNIYSDGLRLESCVRIPENIHEKMKGSQVQPKDVLLNITGASIGRVYYWEDGKVEANVNQHVCIIRANQKVIYKYLQRFLAAEVGQVQIFSGQDGTSREGLNFEELKNFKVTIPPVNEQELIIKKLSVRQQSIKKTLSKVEKQIQKLQSYRQSLISEAVTGKIDVRDWQPPA